MPLSTAALANLQARLDLYYAAESSILRNQSYRMADGRELSRANLSDVQGMIRTLEGKIAAGAETPVATGRARRFVNMSR